MHEFRLLEGVDPAQKDFWGFSQFWNTTSAGFRFRRRVPWVHSWSPSGPFKGRITSYSSVFSGMVSMELSHSIKEPHTVGSTLLRAWRTFWGLGQEFLIDQALGIQAVHVV